MFSKIFLSSVVLSVVSRAFSAYSTSSPAVNCTLGPVDLVFVADGSGSVGLYDFQHVLRFLADLTTSLQIGSQVQLSHVGMVIFSSSASVAFNLDDYESNAAVYDAILKQMGPFGGTDIANGMNVATEQAFQSYNGDRPEVQNLMIVLTDGQDSSDVRDAYNRAQQKGIATVAIGVTNSIDHNQLLEIAGGNDKLVFCVDAFTGLDAIINPVCESIDDQVTPGGNFYCLNGGTMHCHCAPGFTGEFCERAIDYCNQTYVVDGNGEQIPYDFCNFGTCEYSPASGVSCICDHGWTGTQCDTPIPSLVHESHRCHFRFGSSNPNGVCEQGVERCLPDYLNCAYQSCDDTRNIGWCLPYHTVDAILQSVQKTLN